MNGVISPFIGVAAFGAILLPGAVAWAGLRRYAAGGPLRLSRSDTDSLRESRVRIPLMGLDENHLVSEALSMQLVAARLAESISRSPAWQSTGFEVERIRFDLAEELRRILDNCEQWQKMLDGVEKLKDAGSVGGDVAAEVDELRERCDRAREIIMDRIAALHEYRAKLSEVEVTLVKLNKAVALADTLISVAPEIDEAYRSILPSADAAVETRKRSEIVEELQSRLRSELDFIEKNILGPAQLAPLET